MLYTVKLAQSKTNLLFVVFWKVKGIADLEAHVLNPKGETFSRFAGVPLR
jgi:hypothetical protein